MKIGEIAIISHNNRQRDAFIRSICEKLDLKNELVSFSRFDVNNQLALHLYGISIDRQDTDLSWDLISRKMLGYVVIFDWEDLISLESVKPILDNFAETLTAPFVVVGNVKDMKKPPIPKNFFQDKGISLSPNFRFTFGQVENRESARKILTLLIDMLLDRVEQNGLLGH
ncbi:MAG: hypothetical protein GXO74_04515 [Calditrichaeota bacterium]|nr:hypothetical protein [Calditrichota bacterium]